MRVLLGAFGDPGHAFPILALGTRLVERGHDVAVQTWVRWRRDVETAGMRFSAAPEYKVFPTPGGGPLKPYAAAVRAAHESVPLVRDFAPDVCVSDILTLAPAWAAELCEVPVATLVPHVCPMGAQGFPPYSIGARLPRTRLGARLWGLTDVVVRGGLEQGRRDYNDARRRLDLPPRDGVHTGLSRSLTLIGTLPELEYPRDWPAWMRVVGPLMWEPPGERVDPPAGRGPVVLVAPSTAHDAEHRLLRAVLDGLRDAPVRVIGTWNGRRPPWLDGYDPPANAVLVPWLSYAQTMPACDAVVTHGGHGTLARALTQGCPVVVAPAAGDMGENAARADWAGLGVRVPRRFVTPRGMRLAVHRVLSDEAMRTRVHRVARRAAARDGAVVAAEEVERWAADVAGAPAATPNVAETPL